MSVKERILTIYRDMQDDRYTKEYRKGLFDSWMRMDRVAMANGYQSIGEALDKADDNELMWILDYDGPE